MAEKEQERSAKETVAAEEPTSDSKPSGSAGTLAPEANGAAASELRQQALARLGLEGMGPEGMDPADMSPEDVGKLVFELRTHMLELEIQNEELRRGQAELVESRSRYSDLYDTAPAGYVTVNYQGLIVEANLTLAKMLGVKRQALVKHALTDFIFADDQDVFYLHRRETIDCKQGKPRRIRLLRNGAEPLWTEFDAILVAADDKNDAMLRIIIHDITERRQEEERYELATRAGKTGIWDWNLETNELYVDPYLKALLGYEDHELRNHLDDIVKVVHPDDLEQARTTVNAHLEGLTPRYDGTHRMLRKDGSVCWFLARGTAMRDATGRPYRVVGTDTDITDHKQAEEALRAQHERFATVMDAVDAHVFVVDIQTHELLFMNAHARQTFGDHIGEKCWAGLQKGQTGPCDFCTNDRLINGDGKARGPYVWETQNSVEGRWYQCRAEAIPWPDGRLVRLEIATDMESRMEAESALRRANENMYALLNATTEVAMLLTPDGTVAAANQSAAQKFGLPLEELVGKRPFDLASGEVAARQWALFNEFLANKKPVRFEEENNGTYFDTSLVPVLDRHGNVRLGALFALDITEAKRFKDALAQENRIQTTLIEALPYPTMLIKRDRTIIFANRVAREVGAVIGGQCWHDFGQCLYIPEHDQACVNQHREQQPGWTHCTFCLADGALDDSAPKVAPEVNAFGKIWETHWVPVSEDVYLHYGLDITQRKRAEEDLLEAQHIAKLGFWDWNIVSGELCWSDETFRNFGFEPQSFVPDFDRFKELVHPDDLPLVLARVDAALQQGADYAIDFRGVLASGAIRHFGVKGKVQRNEVGEVVRFLGTQIDVTARKQAEEALRESGRNNQALFEGAHDGILVADPAGQRFRTANPAICAMLGYSEDELLKLGVKDLHPKEDLPDVMVKFRKLVSQERALVLDIPVLRKDGSVFLADISAAPLSFSGAPSLLGVFRDITDRNKAEAATLRASLMEATATLAGGVAHDFNNLMVGVLGNAELLREGLADRPEAMEMLGAISSSARQAGDLAKQLLAFARGGKYSTAPLSLNDIVQDTLRLQDRALPPRIRIERDIEPDLGLVEADRTQLTQVVMNLLINAVEAIEDHGRIVVTTRNLELDESRLPSYPELQPGMHVYLCVEDSGCGMDSETLCRVFEPFYSTKSQGRGLGLAAVYGIIRNHGGYISVYSEPGLGTSFKAYLPKTDQVPEKPRRTVSTIPGGNETVLIIDDEQMVSKVAKRMLERLGYRTLTASNGREAVELARSFDGDIHLAMLDMGMPVMGGAEAFPLLKEARPNLKVLICSGYELDRAAQALLDAGASAFVQKPFRMADLGPIIRAAFSDSEE